MYVYIVLYVENCVGSVVNIVSIVISVALVSIVSIVFIKMKFVSPKKNESEEEKTKKRIAQWNHTILNPNHLERYADATHGKGAALENCFAFVDWTVRPISRPIQNQEIGYNGHKRIHVLQFQSATEWAHGKHVRTCR